MSIKRFEKIIWWLIFGGLIAVGLGLAVVPGQPGLGWAMAVIGALVVVLGAVLVWVRSRMAAP